MIQKIVVRIRVVSGKRLLLLRRAEGRTSLIGKYELPGGRVLAGEQPSEAARRIAARDVGLDDLTNLRLDDIFTYDDGDSRNIQYGVIVFSLRLDSRQRKVRLNDLYDKFVWSHLDSGMDYAKLTEVSQIALGAIWPAVDADPSPAQAEADQQSGDQVVIYTDGGSRGNPGPSAAGYVITVNGKVVDQGGEYLGITTNNQAEYQGARIGLEAADRLGYGEVELRVDSMLVVNQLKGIYKIKNRDLWPINERVREVVARFKKVRYQHIPREMNRLADGMVNRTLDQNK